MHPLGCFHDICELVTYYRLLKIKLLPLSVPLVLLASSSQSFDVIVGRGVNCFVGL